MSVHLLSAHYSIAKFFGATHKALEFSPCRVSLHEYMAAILQRGCLPKRRLLPPFSNHRFSKILLLWTLRSAATEFTNCLQIPRNDFGPRFVSSQEDAYDVRTSFEVRPF